MSDIYSAPSSELTNEESGSEFGSVEKGIAGDYELSFGQLMSDAWESTKGNKGTIWVAMIIMVVVTMIVNFGASLLIGAILGPIVGGLISQVILLLVTTPLNVGLMVIAIRCAANIGARSSSIFDYYGKIIPLFLTTLVMYVLIIVGMILLVLPGIYLAISYMFALTLVAEKNMGIWEALETSRKTVTHKWFVVFFVVLVAGILVSLSAIPLLIGLIWTVPWMLLIMGTMYKTMFGIEKSTIDS